jgi:hypothetical protein
VPARPPALAAARHDCCLGIVAQADIALAAERGKDVTERAAARPRVLEDDAERYQHGIAEHEQ